MTKNYQLAMKKAQQLKSWDLAERLWDEVLSGANLTTEAELQRQRQQFRDLAEERNQRDKGGKKI
jgi:hypothetical protein